MKLSQGLDAIHYLVWGLRATFIFRGLDNFSADPCAARANPSTPHKKNQPKTIDGPTAIYARGEPKNGSNGMMQGAQSNCSISGAPEVPGVLGCYIYDCPHPKHLDCPQEPIHPAARSYLARP